MIIMIFSAIYMLENNILKKRIIFVMLKFHCYNLNYCFMKKGLFIVLFIVFNLPFLTAQNNQVRNNPVGTWKFEAPYAPEGYTSGTIVVGFKDQKHTTTMSFTGSDTLLSGEKVRALNDSVLFSIYLEGQDIKVLLKMENESIMSGKAVYSEGEVPLTLTRQLATAAEAK